MMISMFTFAILAYNQANIIGETLESIKYQIEKYGDNRIFKIIVTDDFSKDNTLLTVRKWIEKNGGLFKEVKILTNQSNMGTVYNYNRIMENIDEEQIDNRSGCGWGCIYCDRCYKRIDEYFICKYNGRRCDNDAGWRTGI